MSEGGNMYSVSQEFRVLPVCETAASTPVGQFSWQSPGRILDRQPVLAAQMELFENCRVHLRWRT